MIIYAAVIKLWFCVMANFDLTVKIWPLHKTIITFSKLMTIFDSLNRVLQLIQIGHHPVYGISPKFWE